MDKKLGVLDNTRDKYELELIKYTREKDLSSFGICRGMQIINVALSGDLYQDLEDKGFDNHDVHLAKKNEIIHFVNIEKGNLLYDIVKKERLGVNSYHHQAVNKLEDDLVAIAKTEDNLVEAAYDPKKKFFVSLQWDPEYMYDSKDMKKVAEEFVKSTK